MTVDLRDLFEKEELLNQDMVNVILKALVDNHQSDVDYFKFKQSVINLQKMGMDEPTSIKSAFATFSTMGVSKKRILDSIYHYAMVVEREKEKFASALKHQISVNIDKPKSEAEKFDDMITERLQKIETLKKEIETIEMRKESIGSELEEAENKILKTRDEFREVYDFFSASLNNDKIIIDQILS